jgi:hypothetical protein
MISLKLVPEHQICCKLLNLCKALFQIHNWYADYCKIGTWWSQLCNRYFIMQYALYVLDQDACDHVCARVRAAFVLVSECVCMCV